MAAAVERELVGGQRAVGSRGRGERDAGIEWQGMSGGCLKLEAGNTASLWTGAAGTVVALWCGSLQLSSMAPSVLRQVLRREVPRPLAHDR